MSTERGSLSINSENIFPIIKKWLYSDHDIFVREMISNGADAITKLKKLEIMGEADIPEDNHYKIVVTVNADEKTIKKEFGSDIAELVTQLTHLQNIDFSSEEEGQVENLRKLVLAMASDIRVVLIKIADRLHNMRTLSHLSPEKQKKIALETMEIYVPVEKFKKRTPKEGEYISVEIPDNS